MPKTKNLFSVYNFFQAIRPQSSRITAAYDRTAKEFGISRASVINYIRAAETQRGILVDHQILSEAR